MPPGSLKERPGFAPDNNDDELNPANRPESGDSVDPEKSEKPWQPDGFDEPYPGDKTARPNLGLSESNAQPTDGLPSAGMTKPEAKLAAPSPIDTSNLSVPAKGMNKVIIRGITRKQASYAGGGMGIVAFTIAMYMAGASLYLVHLKNYVTGPNNQYNSTISNQMQRRRVNSSLKILKKASQKMQVTKFAAKAEKAGFEVLVEGGVVKSLKKDGAELILGKSTRELTKDVKNLGKTPAGRAFLNSYDEVSREFGARFMGPVTKRSVYKKILGLSVFIDWIGARQLARAGPDGVDELAELGTKSSMGDFLLNADETEKAFVKTLAPEDLARALNIDINDPNVFKPGTTVDDIFNQYTDEATEYIRARTGSVGNFVGRGAGEVERPAVLANSAEATTLMRAGGEPSISAFTELATKISPRLANLVSNTLPKVVGQSFDLTSLPRQGCRVAGTLEFVKSVRNTLMAIELAKFFVRFMTIADHQQAGLISSTAVSMMSIYLAGATGSTGVQALTSGTVSAAGVSQYGVGYADVGILAEIATFIRKLPWQDPGDCKTVNNPLTMVGGTLAGGALAVLSGGSSYAFSLSWSIGLTVVNELAFAVALPILIGSISGALLTGFEEPGEETGNVLSSSLGALTTMTSGASVGLPVDADTFVGMVEETELNRQEVLGKRSFAERYLDINSSESLMARASLTLPQSLPGIGSIFQKQLSFSSIVTPLSSVFSFASPPASAQETSCEDVTVVRHNLATDGFCNLTLAYVPILDLDQTEKVLRDNGQINLASQPVPGSAFQRFIDNCFSGRPGIGHPIDVNTDGSTEPIDPTCVVGAEGENSDFSGYLDGDIAEDPEDGEEVGRVPFKKERFAAWQGFLVDEENLTQDINDDFPDTVGEEVETAGNNSIYVIGDSLTVGMNGAGDLVPKLSEKGWNVTKVNAVGGKNLKWGTEQLRSDSDILASSGAVLVGLGTNNLGNYPGSMELVRTQMQEIIDIINPPGAPIKKKIYWTDFYGTGTLTTSYGSFSLDRAFNAPDGLNAVLKEIAEQNDVQILPWSTSTVASSYVPVNDVHPNGRYPEMATFIVDAIGAAPVGTGASASGVAQVGAFKMNLQRDPATSCLGVEQPGAKEIQRYINSIWGGGTGYITVCKEVSTGGGATSVHSEGRAVDSSFNALSPTGLDSGNKTFEWLLTNAEAIGVQYIKFWRVQWSPKAGISCVSTKDDQVTHSNHLHFELNWAGARQETPYFTSGGITDSTVTINQEICPRL